MAIAGRTISVPVPHEADQSFVFRSLGHKLLRKANKQYLNEIAKDIADIDIAKLRDAISDGDLDREVGGDSSGSSDYAYDRDMILEAGIVSWTYGEAVSPEALENLDEETAEWAFRQIVDMSRRKVAERKV